MAAASSQKVFELRITKEMISQLFNEEKQNKLISSILEEIVEETNNYDKDFL